ncbi:MAG: DUF4932 domain-containing protein [Janthinobacterium lividum]
MKYATLLLLLLGAWRPAPTQAQAPVKVLVYPGTELLQVIHLLSDTAQMAKSTYNAEVLRYFRAYRRHPAVLAARRLPHISCDFPVRLSWAFYGFPRPKLATMTGMGGYETLYDIHQIQAYFQECLRFYYDAHFWTFYQARAPEYAGWVAGLNRALYQDSMLATLDKFYRLKRDQPVVITLGALNCGSYAVSAADLRGINPQLPAQNTVLVAYHQVSQNQGTLAKAPTFYAPAMTSQLLWHELGHAYLSEVFRRHQPAVQSLAYLMSDSLVARKARLRGGWANYLNENVTQAVTSLLRIRTGQVSRAEELAPDDFYLLAAELLGIIERAYYGSAKYRDFDQFFPVLLATMQKQHPTPSVLKP